MPGSKRQNNMFEATTGYVQDGNPIKKTSCGRRRLKPGPLFKRVDKDKMPCNKPRTSTKPNKKKMVKACEGGKEKIIRFGQQGKKVGSVSGTAGKPKKGESARMKAKRKSFKARHAKNIKKGKMSAAYWADKVKW